MLTKLHFTSIFSLSNLVAGHLDSGWESIRLIMHSEGVLWRFLQRFFLYLAWIGLKSDWIGSSSSSILYQYRIHLSLLLLGL